MTDENANREQHAGSDAPPRTPHTPDTEGTANTDDTKDMANVTNTAAETTEATANTQNVPNAAGKAAPDAPLWVCAGDDCPGCARCVPDLADDDNPLATAFALVGQGRYENGEFVRTEGLCVDAHGILLPDGRAVTYCQNSDGRDPVLHVWPTVDEAAFYWGSCIRWPHAVRSHTARTREI